MKYIYSIGIILLICSCSKKTISEVHFRNGEVKEGYVKTRKSKKYKSSFRFKEKLTKDRSRLSGVEVDKIITKVENSHILVGIPIFRFVEITGHRKPVLLLEKVIGDKVSLFENNYTRTQRFGRFNSPNYHTTEQTISTKYIKMPDRERAFPLRIGWKGKKAKKQLSELFKDCPELVEKIQNDYFKFTGIGGVFGVPHMFSYYNTKCE